MARRQEPDDPEWLPTMLEIDIEARCTHPLHTNQSRIVFCPSCRVAICRSCQLNAHQGHGCFKILKCRYHQSDVVRVEDIRPYYNTSDIQAHKLSLKLVLHRHPRSQVKDLKPLVNGTKVWCNTCCDIISYPNRFCSVECKRSWTQVKPNGEREASEAIRAGLQNEIQQAGANDQRLESRSFKITIKHGRVMPNVQVVESKQKEPGVQKEKVETIPVRSSGFASSEGIVISDMEPANTRSADRDCLSLLLDNHIRPCPLHRPLLQQYTYCTDCKRALCEICWFDDHRNSHKCFRTWWCTDLFHVDDIQCNFDSSGIQTTKLNRQEAIRLHPRCKHECEACRFEIRRPNRFCSIACKRTITERSLIAQMEPSYQTEVESVQNASLGEDEQEGFNDQGTECETFETGRLIDPKQVELEHSHQREALESSRNESLGEDEREELDDQRAEFGPIETEPPTHPEQVEPEPSPIREALESVWNESLIQEEQEWLNHQRAELEPIGTEQLTDPKRAEPDDRREESENCLIMAESPYLSSWMSAIGSELLFSSADQDSIANGESPVVTATDKAASPNEVGCSDPNTCSSTSSSSSKWSLMKGWKQ